MFLEMIFVHINELDVVQCSVFYGFIHGLILLDALLEILQCLQHDFACT